MADDKYRLDDVFGVAREVPANYVVRDAVDGALIKSLARDQHIVIYGSSKQGKTCLRKYNLKDTDYASVTCSNRWTLAQLNAAILKAAGYTLEVSTTKTVGGDFKVSAELGATVGWGPFKANAKGGTESSESDTAAVTTQPMELDPADVNDIIGALDFAECPQFIVLEDVHYLPEDTQKDFAVALKAFHEDSKDCFVVNYCFVVVGVWLDQNRLIQHNGDLTGRVVGIDADIWTSDELRSVIEGGERLLNVTFDEAFKTQLLTTCFASIWVVQESCRLACEAAGVYETVALTKMISASANDLVRQAVDAHSARYNGFILNFSQGFATTSLEMYKWLLFAVLTSAVDDLERGISYGRLRELIDSGHPESPINPGNLTQALQSTAQLQVGKMAIKPIILDYHQTNRRLNVVDRSFLIWLQHQERSDLLALADLPTA